MLEQRFIVKVAVENVSYHFDKLFDYFAGDAFDGRPIPGCRVRVPFGNGARLRTGIIFETHESEEDCALKSVCLLIDKSPVLDENMLKLAEWIRERTFCTYYEACRAMLPAGLNFRVKTVWRLSDTYLDAGQTMDERALTEFIRKRGGFAGDKELKKVYGDEALTPLLKELEKKSVLIKREELLQKTGRSVLKMAAINDDDEFVSSYEKTASKKQKSVIRFFKDVHSASVKEALYFTGVGESVIRTLVKKGVLNQYCTEVYSDPYSNSRPAIDRSEIILTESQKKVFYGLLKELESGHSSAALLYGVTGSGKTQVYLKLLEKVIKDGNDAILMVPEIALTSQVVNMLQRRFGSTVAVFHSGLSPGERYCEWRRIKKGEAHIAVGTRSAVFAPVNKLGLIIVDEEHEQTYKSEQNPKYNAKEVARFRCVQNGALLLLASATPSVESYAFAQRGYYKLFKLTERYGEAKLPSVITADMTGEMESGNRGAFGSILKQEIKMALEERKQVILLLNRRGYSTHVSCVKCRAVITCPHCSISMTYHSANNRFMCHYCGYSIKTDACPACGSRELRMHGYGTQKIEEELKGLFNAKILRLDADSAVSGHDLEKKLAMFANGEYDILLGTQMVAKGFNFENVTLVGVISVDNSLFDSDYRASERTFSLLTQVAGRAGRGADAGKAVIQTYYPENTVIEMASSQNYEEFFKNEISIRKLMTYPPYCDICTVTFVAGEAGVSYEAASTFMQAMIDKSTIAGIKLIILGPAPLRIVKMGDKFRYKLTIKCKNSAKFRSMLSELLIASAKDKKYKNVKICADINPYNDI